jgi:type IV pilus assembly protein PilB
MADELSGSLGSMLIEASIVTAEQLSHAREEHDATGEGLAEALVRLGYVNEDDLYGFLARQVGMEFIKGVESRTDQEVLSRIPGELAMRYRILPLSQEDRTLTVAMADPLNLMAIDDLRLLTGSPQGD